MQPPPFTPRTPDSATDGMLQPAATENGHANYPEKPDTTHDHEPWRCGDPFKYPLKEQKDPWKDCRDMVKKYDKSMCNGWKEEITNLLIFAGLFSAVVTAFTIESYQWLQPNSTDISLTALIHISSQLSASPTNVTGRAAFVPDTFSAPTWAVQVNAFWFLSLTLSLTTAMVGILCLQWLREYERDAHLSPRDSLALRQMLHEGLKKWHVPKILYALPLILQLALVLFFVGLLNLLWTLNHTVAEVAGAFVGLTLLFISVTTILPTFQFLLPLDKNLRIAQCPYKSLQSWAFFRAVGAISWLLTARIVPYTVRIVTPYLKNIFKQGPIDHAIVEEAGSPSSHNILARTATRLTLINDLAGMGAAISDFADGITKWYFVLCKFEKNMWKLSDWEAYDRYWRTMRDVPEEESQHYYDTIRALKWVNKKLPQGIDTTYIIHPCLLDLEIPAAIRAIRDLSHYDTLADNSWNREGARDSLDWFVRFYEGTDTSEQRFMRSTRPKAESDPLHREMISLLSIRHLNGGPYLHPEIRNHYLELYTRIRHSGGEQVIDFFERPLRLSSSASNMNLELNNISEREYVEKMFNLLNTHVPEDTILRLLRILLPHVKQWRNKVLNQRQALAAAEIQTLQPVRPGLEVLRRPSVISFAREERLSAKEEKSDMIQLRREWQLMQPVWNILCQILKSPLPFDDKDSTLRAKILECSFKLCEEMQEYVKLLWDGGDRHHLHECVSGMILLHESMGSTKFSQVEALPGYQAMSHLANTIMGFINEDAAMKWLWLGTRRRNLIRILKEYCKGSRADAWRRGNGSASSDRWFDLLDRVREQGFTPD